MDTENFLRLVLPAKGLKVVCTKESFTNDEGKLVDWLKPHHFPSIAAAAEAALQFDGKGKTVYHACNGYGPKFHEENDRIVRKQENVVACRSIYDDLDVDPDKDGAYDTKEEALQGAMLLAVALRLTPTLVDSGGGYHIYFHCDEDMTLAQWEALSRMKRDINHHLKVKYDPSVDMDSARVLRPIGVHNRKLETPRPVKLLKQGKQYSYGMIYGKLNDYIEKHKIAPAPTNATKKKAVGNIFDNAVEFPDSRADRIIAKCGAVKDFVDKKGDVSEPYWHKVIGIIKHCVNGEEECHRISSEFEGYDHAETQRKIDSWPEDMGPSSCATMDAITGCRANCPYAETVNNPIVLGYSAESHSQQEDTAPTEEQKEAALATKLGETIEGVHIPYWPKTGYVWLNGMLQKHTHDPVSGDSNWVPFCRSLLYPINRIRDEEGLWQIHWTAKEKNGKWRDFFMPTAELASTDLMAKTLAANEIFLMKNARARNHMADFAADFIETLQAYNHETKTYDHLGWTNDFEGFLLGTTLITAKGESQALLTDDIPSKMRHAFEPKGTLEDWVNNIDKFFNRPKAEPFQFALLHSIGSILVEITASSNWHGLPLAFTGQGGTGKTTSSKIACGFFGNPKWLMNQAGDEGATIAAILKTISASGSLPFLLDEMSDRDISEILRVAYMLANGIDKDRLNTSGGFATQSKEFFKNVLITSNDTIHETLAKGNNGDKVEATQLRFFEIQLPPKFTDKVFPEISSSEIEYHMDHVYGTACRPFIQYVIKHRGKIHDLIHKTRATLNPNEAEDKKERFIRDTIVTALVAGAVAKKLGLIAFDLKNLKKWALEQVENMRESRAATKVDMSEHVAGYIGSLHGNIIFTRKYPNGRSRVVEYPSAPIRTKAAARIATEDKRVIVTFSSITDYCNAAKIHWRDMKEELVSSGLLVKLTGDVSRNGAKKYTLGAGTSEPTGRIHCLEFNYDVLFGGHSPLSLVKNEEGEEEVAVNDDKN